MRLTKRRLVSSPISSTRLKYASHVLNSCTEPNCTVLCQCTVQDARPGVQKVAIVVTDGQSGDTKRTALEAKKAADENITVFAVGELAHVNVYNTQHL